VAVVAEVVVVVVVVVLIVVVFVVVVVVLVVVVMVMVKANPIAVTQIIWQFASYWWPSLGPVLDEFIASYEGQVRRRRKECACRRIMVN